MEVEINESVRRARWPGLEGAVQRASELFAQVIPRSLQPLVKVGWERLEDAYGGEWVVVILNYDGRAEERELFRPAVLVRLAFMRERFEWLWGRVLRTAFDNRVGEDVAEPLASVNAEAQ